MIATWGPELWIKTALSLAALALAILTARRTNNETATGSARAGRRAPGSGPAGLVLLVVAIVAAAAYYNFGRFHYPGYVHHWEQFHYQLGSKYFAELGYDGLYAASLAAQLEVRPNLQPQRYMRDLRDNNAKPTNQLLEHARQVQARFTPERWRDFVRDHTYYLETNYVGYITGIRMDHGYNPTPAWTFVARVFSAKIAANAVTLHLLGLLDPLLVACMFAFIFRSFGQTVGCWSLVIFGLGYAFRFFWVGGAFLRQDWLVAWVVALCCLRRKAYLRAGLAFGYAICVRLFPLALVFGVGIVALRDFVRRRDSGWVWRFGAGCALALVLGLGAGSMTGRGVHAWPEFVRHITKHRSTWLTNNVGLENLWLYDDAVYSRRWLDWQQPEPWGQVQEHIAARRATHRLPIFASGAALLVVLGCACWRLRAHEAAALSTGALFAVTAPTCYYWAMLLVVPFVAVRWALPLLLTINIGLWQLHFAYESNFEKIYGGMSWALTVLFVFWSLEILFTGRRRRDPTSATASRHTAAGVRPGLSAPTRSPQPQVV